MSKFSRPYETMDEAALGGFRYVLVHEPHWKFYEYGFLVVGVPREVLKRLGHEGFMAVETRYHYTKPRTDSERESITHTITVDLAPIARAFCHTHIKPSGFSTNDVNNFKKLMKLSAEGRLRHPIVYYMMDSTQQVRRVRTEQQFRQGELVKGLDQATP
jgi:hypothetical protein